MIYQDSLWASNTDSIEIWIDRAVEGTEGKRSIISVDTILIKKALELSQNHGDLENEANAYFYLGTHYNLIDKPLNALKQLQNAQRIIEYKSLTSIESKNLMAMGISYHTLGEYEKAIQKFEEAQIANDHNKNSASGIHININLGNTLARQGKTQEALSKFQKAYDEAFILSSSDSTYIDILNSARTSLGFIYLEISEPQKALGYLSDYHHYIVQAGSSWETAPSFGNMAYCYYLLGNFEKAYDFYYKSLEISERENLDHITYISYKDLSDTYKADGKFTSAIEYLEKYYELKDSLQGAEVQQEIHQLDSKHKNAIQEQEITKLEQKNHIQKQQLFITYGSIAGLLALGFFIFRIMSTSNRHKKEIAQEKLKQTRQREELQIIKVEQLNKELEFKKQDITRMAMDISQKQEFYDDLLQKMNNVKQFVPSTGNKQWRNLEQTIKERLQNNEEQTLFNKNIDKINQAFYEHLKSNFPILSKSDLTLCGFIRLGLSNKEIANVKNVTTETVRVGKFRLKKKFNYSSNEEVEQFLQSV